MGRPRKYPVSASDKKVNELKEKTMQTAHNAPESTNDFVEAPKKPEKMVKIKLNIDTLNPAKLEQFRSEAISKNSSFELAVNAPDVWWKKGKEYLVPEHIAQKWANEFVMMNTGYYGATNGNITIPAQEKVARAVIVAQ